MRLFFGDDPEQDVHIKLLSEVGVMVADYALQDKRDMEEERGLKRFAPPPEPDTNMSPRKAMVLTMAGATSAISLIIMLLAFFMGNVMVALCFFVYGFGILAYCSYLYILHAFDINEKETRYKRELDVWQKKLFCEDCGNFFS